MIFFFLGNGAVLFKGVNFLFLKVLISFLFEKTGVYTSRRGASVFPHATSSKLLGSDLHI